MVREDPVAILERLVALPPGSRRVHYLRASSHFEAADYWPHDHVRAIEAEFARDFRDVAAQVQAAWGPPDFIGHRDDSDFPEWYVAEDLCYWRRDGQLAMIWWEHQDKEVPVLLTLAVMTPNQLPPPRTR